MVWGLHNSLCWTGKFGVITEYEVESYPLGHARRADDVPRTLSDSVASLIGFEVEDERGGSAICHESV